MKINEIFFSVQGEGKNIGKPSIFVRFNYCNLSCKWCDTPYTWDWNRFNPTVENRFLDLEKAVKEIVSYPCKHIVFTGGEPLINQAAILEIISRLPDYSFEIETNGTFLPVSGIKRRAELITVSPKLSSSGNGEMRAINNSVLKELAKSKKAVFKFVVASGQDVKDMMKVIGENNIKAERVYVMAEGKTEKDVNEGSKDLVELCKREGFNMTTRLQILIYGNIRGV
jgi:7-carboxy-7-deazaguanine synthase